MSEIRIDRLRLKVGQMAEPTARLLAQRVQSRLAAARPMSRELAGVANAGPGDEIDALSEQIVSEILRQIRRST